MQGIPVPPEDMNPFEREDVTTVARHAFRNDLTSALAFVVSVVDELQIAMPKIEIEPNLFPNPMSGQPEMLYSVMVQGKFSGQCKPDHRV